MIYHTSSTYFYIPILSLFVVGCLARSFSIYVGRNGPFLFIPCFTLLYYRFNMSPPQQYAEAGPSQLLIPQGVYTNGFGDCNFSTLNDNIDLQLLTPGQFIGQRPFTSMTTSIPDILTPIPLPHSLERARYTGNPGSLHRNGLLGGGTQLAHSHNLRAEK